MSKRSALECAEEYQGRIKRQMFDRHQEIQKLEGKIRELHQTRILLVGQNAVSNDMLTRLAQLKEASKSSEKPNAEAIQACESLLNLNEHMKILQGDDLVKITKDCFSKFEKMSPENDPKDTTNCTSVCDNVGKSKDQIDLEKIKRHLVRFAKYENGKYAGFFAAFLFMIEHKCWKSKEITVEQATKVYRRMLASLTMEERRKLCIVYCQTGVV